MVVVKSTTEATRKRIKNHRVDTLIYSHQGKSKRVYSKLWEFLDRSVRIRVNDEVVIFTDGRKSLVSVKLDCKMLSLGEIKSRVDGIKQPCKCVFSDGRLVKETIPLKFLELVPDGVYCFYINREKRSFYVGSKPPLLAITLRPAKKSERRTTRFPQ